MLNLQQLNWSSHTASLTTHFLPLFPIQQWKFFNILTNPSKAAVNLCYVVVVNFNLLHAIDCPINKGAQAIGDVTLLGKISYTNT